MTTVLAALNLALRRALEDNEEVYLLGEDILDPYGGAFKVTRGLSSDFPERVLTTPVSEAALVGLAGGMALRGLRPVVEIMFGDFSTLIADQMINSLAKFRWMFNDQVTVPVVVRTPMGGRRGYGPTHSQTLERLFLGVPGLQILAPTALGDPEKLLWQAIVGCDDPVFFVENKLLYLQDIHTPESLKDFQVLVVSADQEPGRPLETPTYQLALSGAPPPTLTLAAYGYMAELGRQAATKLAYEDEIFCELIVPTRLSPVEIAPILASTRRTGRLLVLEEGSLSFGWGAEILARVLERSGGQPLQAGRVAARETPIPASQPLEDATLPGLEEVLAGARQVGTQPY